MIGRVIDFVPPVEGIEGDFNTFRLGLFYAKRLTPGEVVHLLDSKEKMLIGKATVLGTDIGTLGEMLAAHAQRNHAMILGDGLTASERLMDLMRKLYGPHIASFSRKTTVIHLRRINEGLRDRWA